MLDKRRTQVGNNRPCKQTQACDRLGGEEVVDGETDRCVRWIKEAIWNRKIAPTMNKVEWLQTQSRRPLIVIEPSM